MTSKIDRITNQITDVLMKRRDITLDDGVSLDDGAPLIRGTQLKRARETEVRGPETYHPFTYVGWIYYGQSFAVETNYKTDGDPLSKAQRDWRNAFEGAGGQYFMAQTLDEVYEELGDAHPEPWGEYLSRSTRIK